MKSFIVSIALLTTLAASAQSYQQYIEKSYDFIAKKELRAAEECLKAAMQLEPANPLNYALLSNLGTLQRDQGELQEALISYSAALSAHPDNIDILNNRAALYSELGETDKALSDYDAILVKDSANQDALYFRGLIYVQKKDYPGAEQDFDLILKYNDKSVKARLGYAILEKMRGNYDKSERIFNYLISMLPKDMTLYEGRADLYFMMGKVNRALSDINKVFADGKPTPALYVLRGKIKLVRRENDSAREDFETAGRMGYDAEVLKELIKLAKK